MKRWTPCVLEWDDAHGGDPGWQDHLELSHKPYRVTSVGLLYRQDKQGITLVHSREGDKVGGYLFVPSCNIVSLKELKER